MGDYDPYDETDLTDIELVEMSMGNPVGESGAKMKELQFNLTKAQAQLISDALAQFDGHESDIQQEVAQRTERFIREKFDLD